jgi:hypothetical protein
MLAILYWYTWCYEVVQVVEKDFMQLWTFYTLNYQVRDYIQFGNIFGSFAISTVL